MFWPRRRRDRRRSEWVPHRRTSLGNVTLHATGASGSHVVYSWFSDALHWTAGVDAMPNSACSRSSAGRQAQRALAHVLISRFSQVCLSLYINASSAIIKRSSLLPQIGRFGAGSQSHVAGRIFDALVQARALVDGDAIAGAVQRHARRAIAALDALLATRRGRRDVAARAGARIAATLVRLPARTMITCAENATRHSRRLRLFLFSSFSSFCTCPLFISATKNATKLG